MPRKGRGPATAGADPRRRRATDEEVTMGHGPDDDVAFFYNLTTGEVEQGRQHAAQHLMGPYPTREAAAAALESARARTEAWDAADEAERDEWDDDDE